MSFINETKFALSFARRTLLISIFVACLIVSMGVYSLSNKHSRYYYFYYTRLLNSLLTKTRFVNMSVINKSDLPRYAVCKSQLSKPLICPKLREARIHVSWREDRLNLGVSISDRWGNELSPYWQARGAAFLMGNSFSCGQISSNTWMKFLPVSVAPLSSNSCITTYPELFDRMCDNSGPDCNMIYAHKCVGAWNYIRDQIQQDTRSAMERWARIYKQTIPMFNNFEMVMFDRCSKDTMLHHNEHGPLAYSVLKHIPKTVTILYQVYAGERTTSLCNALRQTRIEYLGGIRPDITVISSPGSIWQDFAKLVYSPHVLVVSAGSSFALWSTLANVGEVWFPPLYGGMTPDVGNNFHWTNTPVLYPAIGKKLNLKAYGKVEDHAKIIEWLKIR